jgi:hypothetical protein
MDDMDEDVVEARPPPSDSEMTSLKVLAAKALLLEDKIAESKLELKRLEEAHRIMVTQTLPLKMADLGVTDFGMMGGARVEVEKIVTASVSKERKPAIIQWLNKEGLGDIVKRTITIQFGRGEEVWAAKFLRDLQKRKKQVNAKVDETVNHQTYGATIREHVARLRGEGIEPREVMPYEMLGIWEGEVAEVIRPKEKKL